MEQGFIGLHRKIKNWRWYTDTKVKSLFIHLLLSANYTEREWLSISILRGQYVTSIDHLSIETGLTNQEVRTALNKLIKSKEISKTTTNRYTLLTIVKYEHYQNFDNVNKAVRTNKQQTTNKKLTTTKEGKEIENKEKKEDRAFTFLENEYYGRWNEWVNEFKILINDFDKFVMDFNDTVKIEGIDFNPDQLFPRLSKYARNWIKNQNKFNNNDNSSFNNSRKRIDYENEQ
jgi:hypothetical protein